MTMRVNFLFAILFAAIFSASCSNEAQPVSANTPKIQVTSPAFAAGQPIPDKYTGHGDDISPPLQWSGAPPQTKSFALICEDLDAPSGTFTHWVIFNLPATATSLPENVAKTGTLPDGSMQGKNSFGNIGYNGPAPPPGAPHRYFFRLYALDITVNLDAGTDKSSLLSAMNGHVLAEGELMGTYQNE